MKLKKLFAGIVAVAMMATMAAPVFANREEFPCSDTLTLTKTYAVESGTSPAVSFDFTLADDTTKKNDYGAPEKSPLPDIKTWTLEFDPASKGGTNETQVKTIELDFTKFGFDHVGRYYYVIEEASADAKYPGVTSDTQKVYMTVNVRNRSEDAADGFKYYAVLRKGSNDADDKIEGKDAFKNTYNANDLTISKTVHGDLGDLGKTFAFKVKLDAVDGATYGTATIKYNAANNGVVLPDGATNPSTIAVGSEATIYLKHKGEATISNLPAGVTYTVTELESDDAYRVSVDVYSTTTAFNEEDKTASGTIVNDTNAVNFHNNHEGVLDTGVILDNAPYIALLTIVAAGAVVMIMKKRRNYED